MKVALICCGRLENQYAVEFVEYYQNLGFDNIYICDNNYDSDEPSEHFETVLQPYIETGFVIIRNYRNYPGVQMYCYQTTYQDISNNYDWVTFLDFDEFLTFTKDNNVKDYLSRNCFKKYKQILINWKTYGDNNLIYNDDKPCLERFTKPRPKYADGKFKMPENLHVKYFLRTKLNISDINITQHAAYGELLNNYTCNNKGIKITDIKPFQEINWSLAYIKHFTTKTIDEFINNKFIKGTCDGNQNFPNYPIEWFFKYNKITNKKLKYLKEHNIDIHHINKEYIDNWSPKY